MDNAFNRPFSGYTLADLKVFVAAGKGNDAMVAEVARRDAVAAGDLSKMLPGERLRAANKR
jgi:hypothetical protein